MKKLFGWSTTPLKAEQKLANLGHTFDEAFAVLRRATETMNPLRHADFWGLTPFNWQNGYLAVFRLGQGYFAVNGDGKITTPTQVQQDYEERQRFPLWGEIMDAYDAMEQPPRGIERDFEPFKSLSPRASEMVRSMTLFSPEVMAPVLPGAGLVRTENQRLQTAMESIRAAGLNMNAEPEYNYGDFEPVQMPENLQRTLFGRGLHDE